MKCGKAIPVFRSFITSVLVLVSVVPFIYVLYKSFDLRGVPFQAYYDVFLGSPAYLLRFWRSLLMCGVIALGQVAVSVLGGYGFAKFHFRGRRGLLFLLIIIMVLPLQVTLVPNYVMLDALHLLDTYAALVLPAVFIPLGTFLMMQAFRSVPNALIEQAQLDGANCLQALWHILVPMHKSGLVCVTLLSFLDGWSMVEQPITYLKDTAQYPLAVALAYAPPAGEVTLLACCTLALLPPLFLFWRFHYDLVAGITLAEVK